MLPRRSALLLILAAGLVASTAPALADEPGVQAAARAVETEGTGVDMTKVANLEYASLEGGAQTSSGSDIEFLRLGGKDYALAGSLRNGMQIVDVTEPTAPRPTAVYACPITQGDIQVFRQGDRVLATYTADAAIGTAEARLGSQCVTEANALGFDIGGGELGTFIVDLTDPAAPTTVSFIEVPEGSHNQTVHPSGDYLYNSNSDLLGVGGLPEITIHDIRDPARPRKVQDFSFPPIPTSLGTESHDIFFNATGTRAYAAALSSTLVLDTTDPENPAIISQFADPSINVVHQSDLVTLTREDGTPRDILMVTDEQVGAAASASCPGGGLHLYDVTGDKEQDPLANKMGTWFIGQTNPTAGGTCTSHVLRMYPEQELMTIAWYTAGVRTIDISGLADFTGSPSSVARGDGNGMKEVGNFVFPDSDTWSFKTNRIATDGSFFGYGNDIFRGLDIYRFDGDLGRTVPALEPEDLAPLCAEPPIASEYVDRGTAREVHKRSIDCVIDTGIAQGSVVNGAKVYRPLEDVSREQMATFIVGTLRAAGRGDKLPAPKPDAFDDIATSFHRDAIAILAAAGIVEGTRGGTSYAPKATVTREQMASFMVRAAQFVVEPDLAATSEEPRFTDVAKGGVHTENIIIGDENDLFEGTGPTTFSPKVVVKRDQMASFLTNLLGVADSRDATPPSGTSSP